MWAEKAEVLARCLHHGQKDKAGKPYIEHLEFVVEHLDDSTDEMRAVAWLHDSVEDTAISIDEIQEQFGNVIANAILAISKRKDEDYQDYLIRGKQNALARSVKLADLQHNADLSRLPRIKEEDILRKEKYLAAMAFLLS